MNSLGAKQPTSEALKAEKIRRVDLIKALSRLQADLVEKDAKNAQLSKTVESLNRQLAALQSSASWKLTRPIRMVVKASKKLLAPSRTEKVLVTSADQVKQATRRPAHIQSDVCIITNLSFSGGNTSSTLDEVDFFLGHGKSVSLVHVSGKKRQSPNSRFFHLTDAITNADAVARIDCKLLIIRGPVVATSQQMQDIVAHIKCDEAVIVVNNSIFRPTGEEIYTIDELESFLLKIGCDEKSIYPLGPAIRNELAPLMKKVRLSPQYWPPTFDLESLQFRPHALAVAPFIIGRHSRDAVEKWKESSTELLGAYPENEEFCVRILGGATHAETIIGYLPSNWDVRPFGSERVDEFLHSLDAFVYFPHSGLNEAFGRAVMEAILCGVPCILPAQLRSTFGGLAFYCEPMDVSGLVRRLYKDNDLRLSHLIAAREHASSVYSRGTLRRRAANVFGEQKLGDSEDFEIPNSLKNYRIWVETGRAQPK